MCSFFNLMLNFLRSSTTTQHLHSLHYKIISGAQHIGKAQSCPICELTALSISSERTAMLPDKRTHKIYDNVMHCKAPPPNLSFRNEFCRALLILLAFSGCYVHILASHLTAVQITEATCALCQPLEYNYCRLWLISICALSVCGRQICA